jgi:DNA-binding transcriptional MerR regulator
MGRGLQIGRVARETGLTVDAIRFYEKQRLLKRPLRTEGGFRLFTAQDVQHMHFIRRAQQLGFSLNEIRDLLMLQTGEVAACSHVRDLLKTKLSSVREKLAEIQKLENQLAADLNKCERTLRRGEHATDVCCPVLDEIADADAFAVGKRG